MAQPSSSLQVWARCLCVGLERPILQYIPGHWPVWPRGGARPSSPPYKVRALGPHGRGQAPGARVLKNVQQVPSRAATAALARAKTWW